MSIWGALKFIAGVVIVGIGIYTRNPKLILIGATLAASAFSGGSGPTQEFHLKSRVTGALARNNATVGAGLPVLYGSAKMGGIINGLRVDPTKNSSKNLYIPLCICHGGRSGYGIAEMNAVYFDERTAFNAAGVAQSPFTSANADVVKLYGTTTQDWSGAPIHDTDLQSVFPSHWSSTDYGKGVAGCLFYMYYDQRVYPKGQPTITVDCKGNYVEDTRSEVGGVNIAFGDDDPDTITRASGNYTTDGWVGDDICEVVGGVNDGKMFKVSSVATTVLTLYSNEVVTAAGSTSGIVLKRWAHPDNGGDNPALCIRDYLMAPVYGRGLAAVKINNTSFEAAADYCDATVNIPGGTQKRFTCNGWLSPKNTLGSNLQELLSSCRGFLVEEGGQYRLWITQSQAAETFELTDDNIVGDWEFVTAGAAQKFNIAKATYVDPDKNDYPVQVYYPNPGDSNAYLTADNGFENHMTIDLPFTNNVYMAEHLLMVKLMESRNPISCALTATEEALKAQVGSRIKVTAAYTGWSSKSFWVVNMGLMSNSLVRFALREYTDADYTHDSQNTTTDTPVIQIPDPWTCELPSSLVLTAGAPEALVLDDGTYIPRIKVTFTASDDPFLHHYDIEAQQQGDAVWDTWGPIERGRDLFWISPVTAALWNVRIRAVSTIEVASAWVEDSITPAAAGGTTETATVDGWSAAQNTGAPETSQPTITADGAHIYSNLEDANDRVTTYYALFDIDASGIDGNNIAYVTLWYNDAAGSTSWTAADWEPYDNGDNLTDQRLSYSGPLGADFDLRLTLTYDNAPNGNTADLTGHSEGHGTEPGVQYVKYT